MLCLGKQDGLRDCSDLLRGKFGDLFMQLMNDAYFGSRVGDGNLFCINSATIPGITVGNGNKIGAGMVLDKDIANDSVAFYRYKERVVAVLK